MMKKNALLINSSRGEIVDENLLLKIYHRLKFLCL